jgi:hypothetical protein
VGLIGAVSFPRTPRRFAQRGRRSQRHCRRRETSLGLPLRPGCTRPSSCRACSPRGRTPSLRGESYGRTGRASQIQDRSPLGASESRNWMTGWRQDGSRERSVNAGAHGPRPPSRPYAPASVQFNCTFTARHPETGERMGANRSGATGSVALPLVREDAPTCRPRRPRGSRPAEWCKLSSPCCGQRASSGYAVSSGVWLPASDSRARIFECSNSFPDHDPGYRIEPWAFSIPRRGQQPNPGISGRSQ